MLPTSRRSRLGAAALLGIAALAAALPACSSATDEESGSAEGAATAATKFDPPTKADLEDDAYLDIDPATPDPGVKDEAAITVVLKPEYDADKAPVTNPGAHAAGDKFAAATVLATLRRVRRYYHTIPYVALVNSGG